MLVRSRMIRLACLSLLIAMCVALAAGCGGGGTSKDEYEHDMRSVATDITKASTEVSSMKADAPPAARAATIKRQGQLLANAADKADDIEPPADAKDAHEEFVTALRAYAKLLGKLADASKSTKTTQQQAALLSDAGVQVDRLTKASNKLAKAGYTFQSKRK
jgi:hypothetical protein